MGASLIQQVRACVGKNKKVRTRSGSQFFWELTLPAIYAVSMLGQLWAKTKIDDPVKRDYPRYQIDPPYFSCQDQQPGVASPALLFAPNASQQAAHAALEAAAKAEGMAEREDLVAHAGPGSFSGVAASPPSPERPVDRVEGGIRRRW